MSDERRDEWRQVRVTFRKAVSDGNYGTESAEVMLEESCEWEANYNLITVELLQEARALVQAELERSPSQRVRMTIDHSLPREERTTNP